MTGDIAYVILLLLKEVMYVRANIKISPWLPFIMVLVTALFLFVKFNVLDVVMIGGTVLIIVYYVVGIIKRKDAIVIEGTHLKVTSPIRTKEYNIMDITAVALVDHDTLIKATYQDKDIKLITNIYDIDLIDIKEYLVRTYGHITDNTTVKGVQHG